MRSAVAVIGLNFGDEGKGLITDFETRRLGANIVGRFNGGAQAGHTVVDGNDRHVFGHVSAGTFAGADTYLSSKFLVNPILLENELKKLGRQPEVWVHQNARVTTIYDMALNSLAELARSRRHGSCGMGINETVTRHEYYPIRFADLCEGAFRLAPKLEEIRTKWVPARAQELGLDLTQENTYTSVLNGGNSRMVAEMLCQSASKLRVAEVAKLEMIRGDKPIVLEGAQGLALDEYLGTFPHVTRSITGLPYAIIAASELRAQALQPTYVTRAYSTRHGAGALLKEGEEFSKEPIPIDQTNIENQWQGAIRYAPLDIAKMAQLVQQDQLRAAYVAQAFGMELLPPTLAITCLDQVGDEIGVYGYGGMQLMRTTELPEFLANMLNVRISHVSRGPEHKDVTYLD
jgi:adenylosuccinate synthase